VENQFQIKCEVTDASVYVFVGYMLLLSLVLLFFTLSNIKIIKSFLKEKEGSGLVIPVLILFGVASFIYYESIAEDLKAAYIAIQTLLIFASTSLLVSIYKLKVSYLCFDYYI
jgi:hypothetical protein